MLSSQTIKITADFDIFGLELILKLFQTSLEHLEVGIWILMQSPAFTHLVPRSQHLWLHLKKIKVVRILEEFSYQTFHFQIQKSNFVGVCKTG
jgi:hypothetical protein